MLEAVFLNAQTGRIVGVGAKPDFRQVISLCAHRFMNAEAADVVFGDPEGTGAPGHRQP